MIHLWHYSDKEKWVNEEHDMHFDVFDYTVTLASGWRTNVELDINDNANMICFISRNIER